MSVIRSVNPSLKYKSRIDCSEILQRFLVPRRQILLTLVMGNVYKCLRLLPLAFSLAPPADQIVHLSSEISLYPLGNFVLTFMFPYVLSYWLWWSPDFSTSNNMRFTFMVLSENCVQLQKRMEEFGADIHVPCGHLNFSVIKSRFVFVHVQILTTFTFYQHLAQ